MSSSQSASSSSDIAARGYTSPEILVSTEWVANHLTDPAFRFVESNEDTLLYTSGHIPGAVEVDWVADLNQRLSRDYIEPPAFQQLMSRLGIKPETTVVFYGDKNNWWATYAFWVFKLFGHQKCLIMDGGRLKWTKENRPLTREKPNITPTDYHTPSRDDSTIRAFRDRVLEHVKKRGALIDVRSPEEYSGQKLHMDGYPNEGALRGGHIPGAKSVPWARAINPEDGTFRTAKELEELYLKGCGITRDQEVIVYCRIGERSSHTWFVLTYLLGLRHVRNYDGSWTEWGNLVGSPIER